MVQSLSEWSNFHSSNNNMVVSLIFERDPLLPYLINLSWICLWNNLIIYILQRLILQTQIKITKSLSLEENPIPKSIKRKPIIKLVAAPGILFRMFLFHFEKISGHFSLFWVFRDILVNTGRNSRFGRHEVCALKKKKNY